VEVSISISIKSEALFFKSKNMQALMRTRVLELQQVAPGTPGRQSSTTNRHAHVWRVFAFPV
jgi:hypothetical protein